MIGVKLLRFVYADSELNLGVNRDRRQGVWLLIDDCVWCREILPTFVLDTYIVNGGMKLGIPNGYFSRKRESLPLTSGTSV